MLPLPTFATLLPNQKLAKLKGKIKTITPFGAFVEIMPSKDGLQDNSEIDWKRYETMDGIFEVGEIVKVKLLEIDKQGKLKLSRKALMPRPPKPEAAQ